MVLSAKRLSLVVTKSCSGKMESSRGGEAMLWALYTPKITTMVVVAGPFASHIPSDSRCEFHHFIALPAVTLFPTCTESHSSPQRWVRRPEKSGPGPGSLFSLEPRSSIEYGQKRLLHTPGLLVVHISVLDASLMSLQQNCCYNSRSATAGYRSVCHTSSITYSSLTTWSPLRA